MVYELDELISELRTRLVDLPKQTDFIFTVCGKKDYDGDLNLDTLNLNIDLVQGSRRGQENGD